MRILYWDTFAGISGDMALGSLIALGADPEHIEKSLKSTGLTEFSIKITTKTVNGITAVDVYVKVEHAQHHHRHLKDIEALIMAGDLAPDVKEKALAVFSTLAAAEANVHGTSIDDVHFHEVGAVDSIVDIVGTCLALDMLKIDQIVFPELPWSTGFVHCDHGTLPVPAPASLEILKGCSFYDSGIVGELITPTGAALIKTLGRQGHFPPMKVLQVGYGCGKKNYGIPNLLRGVLGE